MGDGVTDFIQDNRSVVLSGNTTVASIGIEKVAGRVAGAVVQPAVWALDYAANDAAPDKTDVGLWGLGLAGGPVGWAAAATGIVKALVDDDTARKLQQARSSEPAKYRPFILACVDYSDWAGQTINAMTVASKGGTAWEHPNGLWVYIVDAKGRPVADYRPQVAKRIYQPMLPLRQSADGRFRWHSVRGGP